MAARAGLHGVVVAAHARELPHRGAVEAPPGLGPQRALHNEGAEGGRCGGEEERVGEVVVEPELERNADGLGDAGAVLQRERGAHQQHGGQEVESHHVRRDATRDVSCRRPPRALREGARRGGDGGAAQAAPAAAVGLR